MIADKLCKCGKKGADVADCPQTENKSEKGTVRICSHVLRV